jgi:putative oxidoreductase
MSLTDRIRRQMRTGVKLAAALAFLPPLATRLVMGQAFFLTGRGKLANFDRTVEFFTGLGIPMPALNAAFVSRLEFYGGILLIVGLATRLAAAGLASTMVVALMTADKESFLGALRGTSDSGLTDVAPFVYLLFLGWLVLNGPGVVSLDRLLFARFLPHETAEPGEPAARAA